MIDQTSKPSLLNVLKRLHELSNFIDSVDLGKQFENVLIQVCEVGLPKSARKARDLQLIESYRAFSLIKAGYKISVKTLRYAYTIIEKIGGMEIKQTLHIDKNILVTFKFNTELYHKVLRERANG